MALNSPTLILGGTPVRTNEAKLVSLNDGEAWTTSLVIAEAFGRRHADVLKSIDALIADGTIDRERDFSLTIRDVPGPKGAIRQERAYRLTERAALIAMPFIGGKKSASVERSRAAVRVAAI